LMREGRCRWKKLRNTQLLITAQGAKSFEQCFWKASG
jgi:hypothetical protein